MSNNVTMPDYAKAAAVNTQYDWWRYSEVPEIQGTIVQIILDAWTEYNSDKIKTTQSGKPKTIWGIVLQDATGKRTRVDLAYSWARNGDQWIKNPLCLDSAVEQAARVVGKHSVHDLAGMEIKLSTAPGQYGQGNPRPFACEVIGESAIAFEGWEDNFNKWLHKHPQEAQLFAMQGKLEPRYAADWQQQQPQAFAPMTQAQQMQQQMQQAQPMMQQPMMQQPQPMVQQTQPMVQQPIQPMTQQQATTFLYGDDCPF